MSPSSSSSLAKMQTSAFPGPSRSLSAPSRARPPNLAIPSPARNFGANTVIQVESPVEIDDDSDNILILSSPSPSSSSSSSQSSPIGSSLTVESSADSTSDDISKDLAALEQLRQSVRQNLRLRPIRSANNLRASHSPSFPPPFRDTPSKSWTDFDHLASSPISSVASPGSVYFTPTSEPRSSPLSALYPPPRSALTSDPPRSPFIVRTSSGGVDPASLFRSLTASSRPLLIDTRPAASYFDVHIKHAINIAIPSLILKRFRKPNGGFQSLDALRQFITTDDGKRAWDDLMGPDGMWDGDVVVYDEEMDEKTKDNMNSAPWALLTAVGPLVKEGSVDYLKGGLTAARRHPDLRHLITSGDFYGSSLDSSSSSSASSSTSSLQIPKKPGGGLFQLDTQSALRLKPLPEIEQEHDEPSFPRSPNPSMPPLMSISSHNQNHLDDQTPSPPPSQASFPRPPPPRRPSIPTLGRLDTKSAERLKENLPKLQVRTTPIKANTLAAPTIHGISSSLRPHSPSHLNLMFSNHSPPGSARWIPSPGGSNGQTEFLPPPTPSYHSYPSTPRTPGTPMPRSPSTARPDSSQPPTTEEPYPVFSISTILPNFLYLGPEITEEEHVRELQALGVERILNIAAECDDDHGLRLKERFEKYIRIPMRDTVEEDNISRGVREVCDILDDARLHSSPTYVHCKAGKSRSVTAVMAYLIHANHWTLSRAYTFVLERRKGISPNIGFVSELMNFEEEELGKKSIGVVKPSSNTGGGDQGTGAAVGGDGEGGAGGGQGQANMTGNYGVAVNGGGRRTGHMRESMPPALNPIHSESSLHHGMSPDGVARVGDLGQETEVKDATGRYRHARRAPVDENTLQPMRRVSKAGLESSVYG
ncbi:hypothetical protein JAAARDRAFT_60470 [Jaapia argillacea MUCL 33604]|uniref:protein-tyrosine-phosphatase n=1 Tax=Jaapia argillacea MUCL 33604 TaxID=933084 RepID=A0A067PT70_9AGAM|nr:hypothetical protein JAAARDRAFT_60470 [Jaapia argillacea MUCL 33604]